MAAPAWVVPDLFNDEPTTGRDHPEANVYAARLSLPRTGSRRHEVLRAIARRGAGGVGEQELLDELGLKQPALRTNVRELLQQGWLEPWVPGPRWRLSQRGYDKWFG